ncbi:MotA/TolQ/ExbB proton channel family protein [Amphritea sp.]|uniref:MotA/TolQ/ExbB proton channel family protein n=1 Tax=Amphritea sp. TaxID=1872502 RepID=UPI003A8F5100
MLTGSLETLLYQLSSLFLWPALLLIIAALCFTLFSMGQLIKDAYLRSRGYDRSQLSLYAKNEECTSDDIELWIMGRLELLRLTSRITPLLGLVATLIPMGPALLALSDNNTAAVGQNMVIAFSGVTLALISASLSFTVLNIRRRWMFEELRLVERERVSQVSGAY